MKTIKPFSFFILFAIYTITISVSASSSNVTLPYQNHSPINPPNWTFETNQPAETYPDNRSLVVSSGCDVNGDGFDDIIVGDKDYNVQSVRDAGRAWLFLGRSAGSSTTPDLTFDPPLIRQDGVFGTNVACAGDVNDDGFNDMMIGMINYYPDDIQCPGCFDEGAEYVYYGSESGPDATPDWMARGNSIWGFMGTTADSAGDVNGDGFDDIIIDTGENTTQPSSHAYVW